MNEKVSGYEDKTIELLEQFYRDASKLSEEELVALKSRLKSVVDLISECE